MIVSLSEGCLNRGPRGIPHQSERFSKATVGGDLDNFSNIYPY